MQEVLGTISQCQYSAGAGEIITFGLTGAVEVEVGASVATPAFAATYTSGVTVYSALLNDDQGSDSKDVTSTPTSFASDETYVKTANGASVAFTLGAAVGTANDSAQATLTWLPRCYYGVAGAGPLSEAQIEALAGSALQSTLATSFAANAAGAADYVWYCFPASYDPSDAAVFDVLAIAGGFVKQPVVSVTNANGVTQDYACWRSANPQLGAITVTVS